MDNNIEQRTYKKEIEEIETYVKKGKFEKAINLIVDLYNLDSDNAYIIALIRKYGLEKRMNLKQEDGKVKRIDQFKYKESER